MIVPPTSVPPRLASPRPAPVAASPRIERLRTAGPAAMDGFWARVREEGTPLVEPDGDATLLTFVWRERRPTRNVLVLANKLADRSALGRSRMLRLPGTDLWHLTYRVRPDWQGSYHFAPDESTEGTGPDQDPGPDYWRQVATNLVSDPYNPRTLAQRTPPHKSVAAAPAALAGPHWWQPCAENPAGDTDMVTIDSDLVVGPRRVWRYRPPGHRPEDGPYPLLVLLDGDIWAETMPVAPILDNLVATGRIPPLVALLLDSVDRPTRFTEYACQPAFTKFLHTDLIEQGADGLGVTSDPARTVIAGQSLGGLAASYAALTAPQRFGNVLSQSGAFWWPSNSPYDVDAEWFARQLARTPREPLRWHVEVGLDEWVTLQPNRHLRDVLTARGYPLTYTEFAGGHDRLCWRARFADALCGLLR
ncbi:enterochelin esterase [Micromonospora craniellae]|uniref:Enterochelin esterase n=1 Tax=Micromonospora craniellae TaxID=2294034 RepID=A0A372G642_9ACTN|nr:enterochelin esterase [Micromonospora craniellae]QOC90131.1 enterochelin esterase [Micromonospora craniellae]RFS48482.1 enterochelin esterase [Micromonospora craniellae]